MSFEENIEIWKSGGEKSRRRRMGEKGALVGALGAASGASFGSIKGGRGALIGAGIGAGVGTGAGLASGYHLKDNERLGFKNGKFRKVKVARRDALGFARSK